MGKVQGLKEKIDAVKVEIEAAERAYDLNKAAELTYAVMPKLQVSLACLSGASRLRPNTIHRKTFIDHVVSPLHIANPVEIDGSPANCRTSIWEYCICKNDGRVAR